VLKINPELDCKLLVFDNFIHCTARTIFIYERFNVQINIINVLIICRGRAILREENCATDFDLDIHN